MTTILKHNKSILCLVINLSLIVITSTVTFILVYYVDPYIHYHQPLTQRYFYKLDNERCMNYGLARFMDYDAILTGSCMSENFNISEIDNLFDVNCIQLSFRDGTYKEVNDALNYALSTNPNVKIVFRSLDRTEFFSDRNLLSSIYEHPSYLYNDTILDDSQYLFNKDILFDRIYHMLLDSDDFSYNRGITSFDKYGEWMSGMDNGVCGKDSLLDQTEIVSNTDIPIVHLTDSEIQRINDNIQQNVITLANQHPNTEFYYFITPYSILWWNSRICDGSVYANIEAERLVITKLLSCPNIRLFSFDERPEIVSDLNNYVDTIHYCEWVNSLILHDMRANIGEINLTNYENHLAKELEYYLTFDYNSLSNQLDYECDKFQDTLFRLNTNISKSAPIIADFTVESPIETSDFTIDYEISSYSDSFSESSSVLDLCQIQLLDSTDFKYVFFDSKRINTGTLTCAAFDSNGQTYDNIITYENDYQWHTYCIDISDCNGPITIVLYSDDSHELTHESSPKPFVFKNISIY